MVARHEISVARKTAAVTVVTAVTAEKLQLLQQLHRNYSYYSSCRETTVNTVTAEKLQKAIINCTAITNSLAATCGPFRVVSYCSSKRKLKPLGGLKEHYIIDIPEISQ